MLTWSKIGLLPVALLVVLGLLLALERWQSRRAGTRTVPFGVTAVTLLAVLVAVLASAQMQVGVVSVLSIPAVLLLVLWAHARRTPQAQRSPLPGPAHGAAAVTGAAAAVYFLWMLAVQWPTPGAAAPLPPTDAHSYAYFATRLVQTGWESNAALQYPVPHGPHVSPYHYLDIWINGFASAWLGTNAYFTYLLFTLPLLYALLAGTWFGVLRREQLRSAPAAAVALAAPLVSLLPLVATRWLAGVSSLFQGSIFFQNGLFDPKLFSAMLLVVVGIAWGQYAGRRYLLLTWLALPFLYVSFGPAVWAGIGMYALVGLFRADRYRESAWMLAATFASALLWIAFHFSAFQTVSAAAATDTGTYDVWGSIRAVLVRKALQFALLVGLPLAVVAWLARSRAHLGHYLRANAAWLLATGAGLAASVGVWLLLYRVRDSAQFFSNPVSVALATLLVWLVAQAARAHVQTPGSRWRTWVWALPVSIALLNLAYATWFWRTAQKPVSLAFARQLEAQWAATPDLTLAYYKPVAAEANFWDKLQHFVPVFYLPRAVQRSVTPVSVSGPDIQITHNPKFAHLETAMRLETPFQQYVEAKRQRNPDLPLDSLRWQYLQANRIPWLLVLADTAPPLPQHLTLVARDSLTGHALYRVKGIPTQ